MSEEKKPQSQFEERKNARLLRAATPGAVVMNPRTNLSRDLIADIQNIDSAALKLASTFFISPDKAKQEKAQITIDEILTTLNKGAKELCEIAQTRYIPTPSERQQEREEKPKKTKKGDE